ncbi:MAG: hypothetical protein GW911_09080 [Armatimonadetes bacterium]|nr:hypothetical protein [Armatimonadota bacterium]NCO91262.1 hypothetical protein [Armatimonadota bacterium]NCP32830.1 hypothetical protein [Armatimonadota bacterium]NCQ32496.1 hypothetical protein [Armatimonadota bacterium]NDK12188.1 hypothetical protein [Armatimonadota bacterium]
MPGNRILIADNELTHAKVIGLNLTHEPDRFMTKPFDMAHLESAVAELTQQTPGPN